MKTVEG